MATNTYVALRTETVTGSPVASVTFNLTGISGYTDLVIVGQYGSTVTEDYLKMQFNSDTTTNYSSTRIDGNGSSARSTKTANQNYVWLDWNSSCENALTKMTRVNIINYANTTTFKTVLVRGDRATATTPTYTGTEAIVSLWRKTPEAITSIVLTMNFGNIAAGSTFSLYGIKAEGVSPAPLATGGAIYSDADYYYHVFGNSGTFTPTQSLTADVLVVAGGGGGGGFSKGGGGGAGGLCYQTGRSLTATNYTVTVGGGGSAGGSATRGASGGNSVFDTTTANGGGGGGVEGTGLVNGINGGSGGGGSRQSGAGTGGSATQGNSGGATGYGNAGGAGVENAPYYGGGGGGGATAAGGIITGAAGGAGGAGLLVGTSWSSATGTGVNGYYAGGGGGQAYVSGSGGAIVPGGVGGIGGGGAGGTWTEIANSYGKGADGVLSTGGGGGGGVYSVGATVYTGAGNGGSGVVIVRYLKE